MTQIISSLSDISSRYEAVFCDLWGCLHNGFTPFAEAVKALEAYRDQGGIVILLTNSPRPKPAVIRELDKIGVARDLYQGIASSGDAARFALAAGLYGRKVFHIGPQRDLSFFAPDPEDQTTDLTQIERVPLDQAEGIVCTGLYNDETDALDDYRADFLLAKTRGLKMLCANPDIIVDRGDRRIYCAGALAQMYTEMGAEAHYFGKPHPPVYDLARNRLNALVGRIIDDKKILCIGDGIQTDIKGAIGEDLDSLFIAGGLAKEQTFVGSDPDPELLIQFYQDAAFTPTFGIGYLR